MTESTTSANSSLATEPIIEGTLSETSPATDESPKVPHSKPGNIGLLLIGLGVFCCIIGFVLMLNSNFGSFQFNASLYGLTGMGGSSIMGGLFLLLG